MVVTDSIVTIVSALIGAASGSLGAAYLTFWLGQKAERRRLRANTISMYLLQLQDAVDSLWYRILNVIDYGGSATMEDRYRRVTTLYALGRVLAYERIMLLDGIYPQLEASSKGLGVLLRQQFIKIDDELSAEDFPRYDRLALAEAMLLRGGPFATTNLRGVLGKVRRGRSCGVSSARAGEGVCRDRR